MSHPIRQSGPGTSGPKSLEASSLAGHCSSKPLGQGNLALWFGECYTIGGWYNHLEVGEVDRHTTSGMRTGPGPRL